MYLFRTFTLVEYCLFATFFWLNITKPLGRKLLIFSSIIFLAVLIIDLTSTEFKFINSLSIGIETIIILCFSFYLLFELINNPNVLFVHMDYRFWVILGILLYMSGSFFIYILADTIEARELRRIWPITYLFYIVKGVFFTISILVYKRQSQKNNTGNNIPYLNMK